MSRPPENNSTDRYLVEKIVRGDNHAFTEIIKQTEGLVAQVVFKMITHPADRKDIVQDIYLKAFKNLPGFKFEAKLSTWIGRIAYNTCINYLEKKKLVLAGLPGQTAGDFPGETHSGMLHEKTGNETERIFSKKELAVILSREIDKLPPVYKTLIVLYHQEEISYNEIAQITGLPEGTVKNYLFRARKLLKENILVSYKREEL